MRVPYLIRLGLSLYKRMRVRAWPCGTGRNWKGRMRLVEGLGLGLGLGLG